MVSRGRQSQQFSGCQLRQHFSSPPADAAARSLAQQPRDYLQQTLLTQTLIIPADRDREEREK